MFNKTTITAINAAKQDENKFIEIWKSIEISSAVKGRIRDFGNIHYNGYKAKYAKISVLQLFYTELLGYAYG